MVNQPSTLVRPDRKNTQPMPKRATSNSRDSGNSLVVIVASQSKGVRHVVILFSHQRLIWIQFNIGSKCALSDKAGQHGGKIGIGM